MCLVVFGYEADTEHKLVLVANRDEFHARPSQQMHWWPDQPLLLAGRDLQAGGTWLAVHRAGRFATVTNYREQQRQKSGLLSRGRLVTDFVAGNARAADFTASLQSGRYAGFSLLAADGDELWYASNRGDPPQKLAPGFYGLSNATLDTPWSKLVRTRSALEDLVRAGTVNESSLARVLADRQTAPVAEIAADHVPFELARAATAPFIVTPEYGTRCTTTLIWSRDGRMELGEHRFDRSGTRCGTSRFSFSISEDQTAA